MINWICKLLIAALLIVTGRQVPAAWLAVSTTVVALYIAARVISPFLVAYFQNPRFADRVKRTLSLLASLAVAALLSAPVVLFHLYRISYFSRH